IIVTRKVDVNFISSLLTDKRHDQLNKNVMFIKRAVKFYLLTQRIINDLGLDEIEANIASP
ncbi:hypothetical protein P4520_29560, partial [Bacillus thuringiensis]